ncbi:MAG: hypothetical protein QOC81_4683 [Thermoanaerobaculia bacterium]|nr:hypothetical protein [Thermoanaerobaculia bacterium]
MPVDDLAIARVRRFFIDRLPVSLADAAAITRSHTAWVLAEIENPERVVAGGLIPWSEVAAIVQRTWTPADLDAAAGTTAGFPALLRVSLVQWRLPAYLLIALERIVAETRGDSPEGDTLTVEAYVARQLDLLLDMDLAEGLCSDSAFREAFEFPDREEQ